MEENNNIPGKGAATASLVLGIICGSSAIPRWSPSFWALSD